MSQTGGVEHTCNLRTSIPRFPLPSDVLSSMTASRLAPLGGSLLSDHERVCVWFGME